MKSILLTFLFIFAVASAFAIMNNPKYKTKCVYGILYYTWKDKPMYINIPVLDKNGNLVKCR